MPKERSKSVPEPMIAIGLRITVAEYDHVQDHCAKTGQSMNDYIRSVIRKEMES